ncbi:GNAT family N-acetyltransferase [Clostridium sp. MSJ-11]|uniref:GNAT family N-acetyltransferase n=1 Tax=Clostridium mobile TaxID=2841512 RepID=A0ABS6EIS1_9CLOT|nr:GNAT family protein [Clostridium mobile]MBU5485115.1 GNAT family N-acetyltransferase [Clostridium mobile]
MLFESSKIKLRKMISDDAELYHKWRNDMEVMASTNPFLDMYHMEETRGFVNQVILGSNSSKSYIILERKTETPMGIISLINIDYKNRNAECIIDIGEKNYWGKGYATESMKLLLDYGFLEMNLHRVYLRVFSFNEKAMKLYEKMGFKYEGKSRQSLFREGIWHDIIHMGILKEEYIDESIRYSKQDK